MFEKTINKIFVVERYLQPITFWINNTKNIKNLVQSALWRKTIPGSSNGMEEQAGDSAPRGPGAQAFFFSWEVELYVFLSGGDNWRIGRQKLATLLVHCPDQPARGCSPAGLPGFRAGSASASCAASGASVSLHIKRLLQQRVVLRIKWLDACKEENGARPTTSTMNSELWSWVVVVRHPSFCPESHHFPPQGQRSCSWAWLSHQRVWGRVKREDLTVWFSITIYRVTMAKC